MMKPDAANVKIVSLSFTGCVGKLLYFMNAKSSSGGISAALSVPTQLTEPHWSISRYHSVQT